MLKSTTVIFHATILVVLFNNVSFSSGTKSAEISRIGPQTMLRFSQLFLTCVSTVLPNKRFIIDNLQDYINSPSKTTVGVAPKFTANRKFFANLITTLEFKEMLAKDEEAVRKNFVKKLKYCDKSVMDPSVLQDFYDREVDQSKI